MGRHGLALLAALDTACGNVDALGHASAALFATHPDHEIIVSFPGLADSTGARLLAEVDGDAGELSQISVSAACAHR